MKIHRNFPDTSYKIDILYIVFGILISVMAVLAFLNPKENSLLFPIIFFTAAFLKYINGFYLMENAKKSGKKSSYVIQFILAVFLTAVALVSAISIWK